MIFSSYAEQKEEFAGMKLVSCGHVFAKPKREIYRPRGRADWLLFFVAKESETFYIQEKAVTADAGSFILFAPGEKQHHVYQGDKTAEFYYVHFKCDALPNGISPKTSQVYSVAFQQQACAIFEEMIEETLQKKSHYEMLCISRILHLLTLIQRENTQGEHPLDGRERRVTYAIQHMHKYCDGNLKLEDYAAMCYMSKYHFLRVFKQVTGASPLEYRNRIRIENAKELLENGYLSVGEIGETLGFSSSAYFSDAFKKVVGVSPVEYRRLRK